MNVDELVQRFLSIRFPPIPGPVQYMLWREQVPARSKHPGVSPCPPR